MKYRTYRSFNEARKYVRSLKLNKYEDWRKFYKTSKRPEDIPSNPVRVYDHEWTSWPDFLGTDYVATQKRKFRSIANAKKYIQKFGIKGQYAWAVWLKTNKLPKDIPNDPGSFYRKQGTWKGWGDFLGTGNIAPINKTYCSFSQAKKFARKSGMKSQTQWRKYCKSGKKPDEIPMAVQTIYKKEWKGWGDFLGTGNLSSKDLSKQFLPPKEAKIEARKVAKKLGIKTRDDWEKAHKAGKIPKNLPFRLSSFYDPKSKRNKKK